MSQDFDRPLVAALGRTDHHLTAPFADEIELIRRRKQHLRGSYLFYKNPVHIVRGEGVWLFDNHGRRYLDCYNNVASVGHSHRRVARAMSEQAAQLSTHTRYLHEGIVEYAEQLAATFPGELAACFFVCTGTEANELAMSIARAVTGKRGAIVMENSYHGNTQSILEMSTCAYPASHRPAHIAAIEPPNRYRGPFRADDGDGDLAERYADLTDAAICKLQGNGEGVAAFMCDAIFDTQGALEAPPSYFKRVYEKVRAVGGLCIADEVQAGLARTGDMWGFERHGVVPDIVTCGKPMGAGYPIAVVVTTPAIADAFEKRGFYFNTYAGNPVYAAVGKTVLDIVDEERIQENVQQVGSYLRERLDELGQRQPLIGDVRGFGLFQGLELVSNHESREPAMKAALRLAEAMRDEGVLLGATGRYGNVIKIRPPLVFSREGVDLLVEKLDRVLPNITNNLTA